jgi:hypothetical protein
MLKLDRRKGEYYYARGTFLGKIIEKSLKTTDRKQAEILLIKLQNEIFDSAVRGVPKSIDFSTAADRYIKSGGENKYINPLIKYFGDISIDKINIQMIDLAAQTIYPNCKNATKAMSGNNCTI